MAVFLLTSPETPRWLVERGRLEDAKAAMRKLRLDGAAADAEVEEIRKGCEDEAREKAQFGWERVSS